MSLCDQCYAPGNCCKRLQLIADGHSMTFWDETAGVDIQQALDTRNLPFVVNEKIATWTDENGKAYSTYNYNCTKLLPNGRCGDYENRPELCRSYEPASDGLCVHYLGAEGTGEGL